MTKTFYRYTIIACDGRGKTPLCEWDSRNHGDSETAVRYMAGEQRLDLCLVCGGHDYKASNGAPWQFCPGPADNAREHLVAMRLVV